MKKTYIQPQAIVLTIAAATIIATSGTQTTLNVISDEEVESGSILVKGNTGSVDWNDIWE